MIPQDNLEEYLKVKDFAVSGETFSLLYNKEYEVLETRPQPSISDLPNYYKSEDYISHTDAKRNWLERGYHIARNFSLKRKLRLVNSLASKHKNILDYGCGTGEFLKTAKNDSWSITGIEPDEKARKIANTKTDNAVFSEKHLKEIKDHSFDVITLWHVLEHIPDLEEKILTFKRILKKDGSLIIAVPNFKSFDAKHYGPFWAAYDVPRHLWHFSQTSISKIFKKHGMRIAKKYPLVLDAYYISLLSEKYKTKKASILNAIYIGTVSNFRAKRSGEYSSIIYMLKHE